jgi:hypothetical protein
LEAAELYSVTELESLFVEVSALGERQRIFANHLRSLRQKHDIESIITIVGGMDHES